MFTVAVYFVDQVYGGSEEGGWWYTFGEPSDEYASFTRGFRNESAALRYMNRLEYHLCRKLNQGRPSIDSILSEGEYRAVLSEGQPKSFPEEHPHYE